MECVFGVPVHPRVGRQIDMVIIQIFKTLGIRINPQNP